jgi:PAS domain-containing protein
MIASFGAVLSRATGPTQIGHRHVEELGYGGVAAPGVAPQSQSTVPGGLLTCVVDMQSQILALSPMFASVLGSYEPLSLVGRTLLDFVHPSSMAVIDASSAFGATADGVGTCEVRLVRLDGEELHTRCSIDAVELDGRQARHLTFDLG